jgi:hypothetical protein
VKCSGLLLRKINRPTPSVSFAAEAERVRVALIAQVLSIASKSENELKRNEERVERYVKELEINDVCGDDGGEFLREKNEGLRAKLEKLKRCKWYVAWLICNCQNFWVAYVVSSGYFVTVFYSHFEFSEYLLETLPLLFFALKCLERLASSFLGSILLWSCKQ